MNKFTLILSAAFCFFGNIPNTLLMSDKPVFNCPKLFDAINLDLQLLPSVWNTLCYTENGGDESGSGGDESGDDESGSGEKFTNKYWICDFECNKYRDGCINLGANIYSSNEKSKIIKHNKQGFLKSCIGWEDISTITTITKITSATPSITTYFTKSTIPITVTDKIVIRDNKSEPAKTEEPDNKLAGDIAILTTLGLMVLSALGVCIYYTFKNPMP